MYKNFKDMDAEMLHKMSWEVVEVFDSYLSGLGVMIPCDDFSEQKEREEENSDAALYGTEYWNLDVVHIISASDAGLSETLYGCLRYPFGLKRNEPL